MFLEEKRKRISIVELDKKLWKLFSKYIRSRNVDWKNEVPCFTCGVKADWRTQDAGHYIPKATSGSYLKYEPRNVHNQCVLCNRVLSSNHDEYTKRLILEYGGDIIRELNSFRNQPPLTVTDYQTKIKYYSQCLKSL